MPFTHSSKGDTSGNSPLPHSPIAPLRREVRVHKAPSLHSAFLLPKITPESTGGDKIGIGLSIACMIKCIGVPIATVALPSLGAVFAFAHNPLVVWGVCIATIPFALRQLVLGGISSKKPSHTLGGLLGLGLLVSGAASHSKGVHAYADAHEHAQNPAPAFVENPDDPICSPSLALGAPTAHSAAATPTTHLPLFLGGLTLGATHYSRLRAIAQKEKK